MATTTTAILLASREKTLLTSSQLIPKYGMGPSCEIIKTPHKINWTVQSYVQLIFMNYESHAIIQQQEKRERVGRGRERDNWNNEVWGILPTIFFSATIHQRLISGPYATYCEKILQLKV